MTSTVLVTGATGFIGRALVAALLRDGCEVIALSRDARAARAQLKPPVRVIERLDAIDAQQRIDAIVHLAGARVIGPPWTPARRALLQDSRSRIAAELLSLVDRLQHRPATWVSASAVGWYGRAPRGADTACDELQPPQPGQFQSDLCVAIERDALQAHARGLRTVRLRFGIVLGRDGGAYPAQAHAARLGLAAVLGSGRQPLPWVHLADAVGLLRFALRHPALSGPVNAVAPGVRLQAEFAQALAASVRRPQWLRVPAFPLKLALGEMSDLLLDGRPVVPAAALRAGYEFAYPRLEAALADLAQPA